jgi:hypothetical protein
MLQLHAHCRCHACLHDHPFTLSKFFIRQLMHKWIVLKENFKIYIKIDIVLMSILI